MTEFISRVSECIKSLRPNVEIDIHKVVKNNDVQLTGLNLMENQENKTEKESISPVIYLDAYYQLFIKGKATMDEIAHRILKVYDENKDYTLPFDIKNFYNYEWIRTRLSLILIGPSNAKRLDEVSTIPYLNLYVVLKVILKNDRNGSMSITVKKEHLRMWGISMEEAVKDAVDNDQNDFEIRELKDLIKDMMILRGMPNELIDDLDYYEDSTHMVVISTKSGQDGAKNLYTLDALAKVSEKVGKDLYIIPSSIHELICIPVNETIAPGDLVTMLNTVNSTEVSPEEVLSDTLYFYDKSSRKVSLVECVTIHDFSMDA